MTDFESTSPFPNKCCPGCGSADLVREGEFAHCESCGATVYPDSLIWDGSVPSAESPKPKRAAPLDHEDATAARGTEPSPFPNKCCPRCGSADLVSQGEFAHCESCGATVYPDSLKWIGGAVPLAESPKPKRAAPLSHDTPASIDYVASNDDEEDEFWREYKPKPETYTKQEIDDLIAARRLWRQRNRPFSPAGLESLKLIDSVYEHHNTDDLYLYWQMNSVFLQCSLRAKTSLEAVEGYYRNLRPDIRPDPVRVVKASLKLISKSFMNLVENFYMAVPGVQLPDHVFSFLNEFRLVSPCIAGKMNVPASIFTETFTDMIKLAIEKIGRWFQDSWHQRAAIPYYGEAIEGYGAKWVDRQACNKRPNDVGFDKFVDFTANILALPDEILNQIVKMPNEFKRVKFRHFFTKFEPFCGAIVLLHNSLINACSWEWKSDVKVEKDYKDDVSWDLLAATFFGAFVPTVTTTVTTTTTDLSRWVKKHCLADSAKAIHKDYINKVHRILDEMRYCWN